jgi:hypothetical protein
MLFLALVHASLADHAVVLPVTIQASCHGLSDWTLLQNIAETAVQTSYNLVYATNGGGGRLQHVQYQGAPQNGHQTRRGNLRKVDLKTGLFSGEWGCDNCGGDDDALGDGAALSQASMTLQQQPVSGAWSREFASELSSRGIETDFCTIGLVVDKHADAAF